MEPYVMTTAASMSTKRATPAINARKALARGEGAGTVFFLVTAYELIGSFSTLQNLKI
jgi:hypothetical protein